MPTYLLAMIVSDFTFENSSTSDGSIQVGDSFCWLLNANIMHIFILNYDNKLRLFKCHMTLFYSIFNPLSPHMKHFDGFVKPLISRVI